MQKNSSAYKPDSTKRIMNMPKKNIINKAVINPNGYQYFMHPAPQQIVTIFFLFLLLAGFFNSQAQNSNNTKSIIIQAIDGLQYDVVRFKVKPGEKIKLTLKNVSDMSHNLLIVRPGTTLSTVNAALRLAEKGPHMNYIPKINDVLWSIPVISPEQTKSVTFTAPAKPGIYPYVCTFPGHGYIMYGAMYVMQEGNMPDIKKDKNIPETRRQEDSKNKNSVISAEKNKGDEKMTHTANHPLNAGPHPYTLTPPYLYHAFLDDVSPAAIAVRLPNELSYCWDKDACRLSYTWKGGFVDMTDLWKGHFNASAKVLGDVFYKDGTEFPFRLGAAKLLPTMIQYKGYRLINEYPEFHYIIDGIDVYEMIREKPDGNGLIRFFRIPNADRVVWFCPNKEENVIEYVSSGGTWKDGELELSLSEAKNFTITMMSYYLAYKYKKK